jgi:hypothetical protein
MNVVPDVPEIGPHFGDLLTPPGLARPGRPPLWIPLDDIRLTLVTGVLELAGAARELAAGGDRAAAVATLGRQPWSALWDQAVASAAGRIAETVDLRLASAAAESRYPRRRLEAARLTTEETRAIAARLGANAEDFALALDALEQTLPAASAGEQIEAGMAAWREALAAAARRMGSAWLALEDAVAAEETRWRPEVAAIRAWRRPRWPLWLVTALVVAAAVYLGLVAGGYLPAPEPLRPFAEFWWRWP